MRSFIKSHRKANSLDESPAKSNSSSTDIFYSQRPSVDPLVYIPTSPSQTSQTSNGPKNSPGFESFHRLANKKMFSSKLFKKSSSTNLSTQAGIPSSVTNESYSAPGTPQVRKWEVVSESSNSSEDLSKFPAIKGTITHSWGDQAKNSQPLIRLNNPCLSTSDLSSDLEPAVRISSLRRQSAMSALTTNSYENTVNSYGSTEEVLQRNTEPQRDKHVYVELSKVKSKNRQVRIHSHDDIIDLEKNSSVSLQLLASTATPATLHEELSEEDQVSESSAKSKIEKRTSSDSMSDAQSAEASNPARSLSSGDHIATSSALLEAVPSKSDFDERENTSDYLSPLNDNDYDDDDDDDASKFSFEINGLNGRTSSIKYYSKPEPTEAVYVDDMYEDEIFDDDMNFYEESFDDMDFPSNDINLDSSESGSLNSEELNSIKPPVSAFKPMKTYNDLFDLSDDEDEGNDDYTDNEAINDDDKSTSNPRLTITSSKPIEYSSEALRSETIKNSQVKKNQATYPIKSFSDIFDLSDDEYDDDGADDDDDDDADDADDDDDDDDDADDADDDDDDDDDDEDKKGKGGEEIHELKRRDFASDEDEPDDIELNLDKTDEFQSIEKILCPQPFVRPASANPPKTPVHILVTSPIDPDLKTSSTISDPHLGLGSATNCLPPPARSQTLKFHDLSSHLDSDVPGMMSNLYFIDETEEDKYNEKQKSYDDDYLDEINTVPEDFNFSDSDQETNGLKSPLRCSAKGSFRSTHSYSGQPTGTAKENTPTKNKLEIKNKTVTFFDHSWDRSPSEKQRSVINANKISPAENFNEYIISPNAKDDEQYHPVTPTSSFSKPNAEYLNEFSLSPIQESSSSVDNSPIKYSSSYT